MPFEHEYTHTIVCPFCGYKYPDPLEVSPGEEDIGNLVCSRCEKIFNATRHISIQYSTEKVSNSIWGKEGR